MGSIERRLDELGIKLPKPVAAIANYLPAVRSGSHLFISAP